MFAGGLRTIDQINDDKRALADEASDASAAAGDLGMGLEDVRGDAATAEAEYRGFEVKSRDRDEALEGAQEKREQYVRESLQNLADDINVSQERLKAAWDLANFYVREFQMEYEHAVALAVIELCAESENAWGEIIRMMHAIFMKMNDASLGTRTSASGMFDKPRYFSVKPQINDRQYKDAIAQAQQMQRDVEANIANLNKKKNETYYNEQVTEAQQKAADARAKSADAKAKSDFLEAEVESVKEKYKTAREEISGFQKNDRELEKEAEKAQKLEREALMAQRAANPSTP